MKKIAIIKHFVMWLFNLILYVGIIAGTIYACYWVLIKFRHNGEPIGVLWAEFFLSIPFVSDFIGSDNMLVATLGCFIPVIIMIIGEGFIYFVSPLIVISIACVATKGLIIRRKNNWCEMFICFENTFHLKHKKRLTGTEWNQLKNEKFNEEKAKRERERAHNRGTYSNNQQYEKSNQYYQEQQKKYDDNQSTGRQYPHEVEKAKDTLMLDSMDFTLKELKSVRNIYMTKFHTDNSKDIDDSYAQKINAAFDILKNYARNE